MEIKLYVDSPKKHPTQSECPGQDEGHPEVNIAPFFHIWQVIFKSI